MNNHVKRAKLIALALELSQDADSELVKEARRLARKLKCFARDRNKITHALWGVASSKYESHPIATNISVTEKSGITRQATIWDQTTVEELAQRGTALIKNCHDLMHMSEQYE